MGVFGEVCGLERVLKEGDRLEFYRPLIADAKTARRLRAKSQSV
ncbi:MAG: RnfH family protein [Pseudomonadales bacterium]